MRAPVLRVDSRGNCGADPCSGRTAGPSWTPVILSGHLPQLPSCSSGTIIVKRRFHGAKECRTETRGERGKSRPSVEGASRGKSPDPRLSSLVTGTLNYLPRDPTPVSIWFPHTFLSPCFPLGLFLLLPCFFFIVIAPRCSFEYRSAFVRFWFRETRKQQPSPSQRKPSPLSGTYPIFLVTLELWGEFGYRI